MMAALGSGEALIASGLAGIVQVLSAAAIWADGRRRVVATAFAEMEPDQVEECLQHDTRNLTLRFRQLSRRQQHLITRK